MNKYYEGLTTGEEEQKLMMYFSSSDVHKELYSYKNEFYLLSTFAKEKFSHQKASKRTLKSRSPNKRLSKWKFLGRIAASITLILSGYLIGTSYSIKKDNQIALNLENSKNETEKVRSQLVLTLMDQSSANKRLQGVNEANKLNNATETVIKALFAMLNNDTNVNVRLAAVESLTKYVQISNVREGLVKSIVNQESPLVQIALADLMVALQEKTSIKLMEKLLEQPDIDNTVKQKIQGSIQEII